MTIRSHRDLIVWQKAMDYTELVYKATSGFPVDERYGLTSQFRRAAVSIPANISEGKARSTRKDFSNFLAIARGSLMECDTFTILSRRLGYLPEQTVSQLQSLADEIGKMLNVLRKRLSEQSQPRT